MKILILAPYPPFVSPSQRFRFEHYLQSLSVNNIEYDYNSFINIKTWDIIFKKGYTLRKAFGMITGFCRRFISLFKLYQYSFVYIHREAAPIGPPVFEFIISKILRKKIIYDFDDAIWVRIASIANPLASSIKCSWKVKHICKWSYTTTVGNDYLADYAIQYCKNVVIIPTVVDTIKTHNQIKNQLEVPLTIGWTGTFTNFYNLELVVEAIKKLQIKYNVKLIIISNKDPMLSGLKYELIKWNKETEISDLLKIHIGVMPLYNTEVELGKCAFKAIQYMSLGIPAVVSPVGTNKQVVSNGINGFWADTEHEWLESIEMLITDADLRTEMGMQAKETIEKNYSVVATVDNFIKLFV